MGEFSRLAILVLNYNGWRHVDALLSEAAFVRDERRVELIIVDNASADDSVANTRQKYPWVTVIRNDGNFGWGGGYNAAIATLKKTGREFSHYMFLNNDVFMSKEWLDRMLAAAIRAPSQVGEIGCRSVFVDQFTVEKLFEYSSEFRRTLNYDFDRIHSHSYLGITPSPSVCSVSIRHQILKDRRVGDIQLLYALVVVNSNQQSTCRLVFEPGFSIQIETVGGFRIAYIKRVPITEGSESSNERVTLDVRPREAVRVVRLASAVDQPVSLIQNSGIGVNKVFEGYDMHCYEPVNAPQNKADLKGVCGVCKLVTKRAFEKVGGFDPHFFMYYEDLDFSLNLKRAGFACEIEPDAKLLHIHAGSSGAGSLFFKRQVAWSRYYFHYRHAGFLRKLRTWLQLRLAAREERREANYPPARVSETALQRAAAYGLKNYFRSAARHDV